MNKGNIARRLLLLDLLLLLGGKTQQHVTTEGGPAQHQATPSYTQGSEAYDPEASITGLYTGPYFDPLTPRNMTAHLGDEAKLPCTVRQLGDKSVSWVRVRDADILTVDRYTFVGDERFESHYSAPTETWNLVIRYVQERDAGEYECQVSTEPKMSQFFSLRVVIPKVKILPVGDRYVKAGSTVIIDCQITDVVQLPDYIFWYHEHKRVMAHNDPNLMVKVKRTDVEAITSTFTIHKVRQEQSGNYTCMPSNLHAASLVLHVINEKHPAAMQGERNSAGTVEAKLQVTFIILLLVFAFTASWNVQQGNCAAKSKPKKQQTPYPATVAVFSSPAASCHHLSPPYFQNLPYHSATTAVSSQGQQEAFDILWKLLKIDALRRAQEVSPAEEDEAELLCGTASHVEYIPRSIRVEEMLDVEGCGSSLSLKRWNPPELTVDEAQEQLGLPGEEETEDTSSGRTPVIKAASSQPRHFPSKLQVKSLRSVDRGMCVASCR